MGTWITVTGGGVIPPTPPPTAPPPPPLPAPPAPLLLPLTLQIWAPEGLRPRAGRPGPRRASGWTRSGTPGGAAGLPPPGVGRTAPEVSRGGRDGGGRPHLRRPGCTWRWPRPEPQRAQTEIESAAHRKNKIMRTGPS